MITDARKHGSFLHLNIKTGELLPQIKFNFPFIKSISIKKFHCIILMPLLNHPRGSTEVHFKDQIKILLSRQVKSTQSLKRWEKIRKPGGGGIKKYLWININENWIKGCKSLEFDMFNNEKFNILHISKIWVYVIRPIALKL